MIQHFEVLAADERNEVLEMLERSRRHWVDRAPNRPGTFYTMGRAAYLDACPDDVDAQSRYYRALPGDNAILRRTFPRLYQRLEDVLSEVLGAPAALAATLAVPGFHIFYNQGIVGAGNASRHFDIQFGKLDLPGPLDDVDPVSFTLALALPEQGSGIDIWNITVGEYERAFQRGTIRSVDELAERKIRAYYAYRECWLFLHRGLLLHRLNTPGPLRAHDRRITLQGHALRIGGHWLLYW